MPRVDPDRQACLEIEGFPADLGFPFHDAWVVDLAGGQTCTIQQLRGLIDSDRRRSLSPVVRGLFGLRSLLGRGFRLDAATPGEQTRRVSEAVPTRLTHASLVPPGTHHGPFSLLYELPTTTAYQIRNATVHAILIVTLNRTASGHRLLWATHVKPVGRITGLYMGAIDPFRRFVVYPGLESWLQRAWREQGGGTPG